MTWFLTLWHVWMQTAELQGHATFTEFSINNQFHCEKALMWPVAPVGCETWTLQNADDDHIGAFKAKKSRKSSAFIGQKNNYRLGTGKSWNDTRYSGIHQNTKIHILRTHGVWLKNIGQHWPWRQGLWCSHPAYQGRLKTRQDNIFHWTLHCSQNAKNITAVKWWIELIVTTT